MLTLECPSILLTVSMDTPCSSVMSVANVVPCRMCGKKKRDACTKPQGFQIRLVSGISHEREQCFPFIAVELLHQPYGFGQQFDTTRHTCLVAVELQPKATLVVTHKMGLVQFHQITICSARITGKEENIPCRFHFLLQVLKVESL